jgi:hypothetical protein
MPVKMRSSLVLPRAIPSLARKSFYGIASTRNGLWQATGVQASCD